MILSTPFSRQHRSHQTWTNGYGSSSGGDGGGGGAFSGHSLSSTLPRKPAPEQRAPDRPRPSATANGLTNSTGGQHKSSTLNRLDVLKQRASRATQQHASAASNNGHFLRRNASSSMGRYTTQKSNESPDRHQQIYSPASIASPSEYSHATRRPLNEANGVSLASRPSGVRDAWPHAPHQQHYAATSVRSVPVAPLSATQTAGSSKGPASDTAATNHRHSGRESALGSLFGTIRRKATSRWSSSSSSAGSAANAHRARSASSLGLRKTTANGKAQAEPIYANGLLSSIPAKDKKRDETSRPLEAEEIYAEGAHAIDSNAQPRSVELELLREPQQWAQGETRTLVDAESKQQADYQLLTRVLINWINDELADQRIIIKELREDLYDGQVLCKLIERLQRVQLDIVEVTQNEQAQKCKLHTVLSTFNRILGQQARAWAKISWTVEGIHQKNVVEIIRLLVTLAKFYRAPIKLPPGVVVSVSVYQKNSEGHLTKRPHRELLTDLDEPTSSGTVRSASAQQPGAAVVEQRDAFDALVEHEPQKLALVAQTLVKFCNRHLEKVGMIASQQLNTEQFSDGLLLVFLISSLEGYFVPLGQLFTTIKVSPHKVPAYHETSLDTLPFMDANNNDNKANLDPVDFKTALEPTSFINTQPIEKLHNVNLALQLIQEAGITQIRQLVRAEDIVNGDLKALLRVLYALFSRYKHL